MHDKFGCATPLVPKIPNFILNQRFKLQIIFAMHRENSTANEPELDPGQLQVRGCVDSRVSPRKQLNSIRVPVTILTRRDSQQRPLQRRQSDYKLRPRTHDSRDEVA
jgi:hypothetical protein